MSDVKRGRGRPIGSGLYSEAIADEIAERLGNGIPMAQICRDEHMPSDRTVREWMANDAKFSAVIADARVRGYDFIAADCLNIADDNGKDVRYTENGDVTDTDVIQRSKLRIETRLKLLAKWDPKRYGDKIDVNQQISGSMDLKIVIGESVNPVETTSGPDGDYD